MSLFSAKYSGQTREKSWHSSKLNQTNCGGGDDDNDDDDMTNLKLYSIFIKN